MITAPPRRTAVVPSGATKQAVSSDGQKAVQTTTVQNTISGDNILEFSLIVAGGTDIANIAFLKGIWNTTRTLPAGVTFSSPNFADYATFMAYFSSISTVISGFQLSTDNVENFQSSLKFVEKQPTGKTRDVDFSLRRYRSNLGVGYGETLEVPAEDCPFVIWEGQEISFSKIKATSQVDFYLNVTGWNKAKELSPLTANII